MSHWGKALKLYQEMQSMSAPKEPDVSPESVPTGDVKVNPAQEEHQAVTPDEPKKARTQNKRKA